jgi:hypothetical protein
MTWPARAPAQVPDQLRCYKVKDPVKLKGVIDLNTAQFGAETGCSISRAELFCVSATETVVSAKDKKTAITPLAFWAPPTGGDRVCYKVKCKRPLPADQQVTDQFGTRTLGKLTPSILCAPAVEGAAPNAKAFRGFPASGQTTCWDSSGTVVACPQTGQDGDIRGGAPLAYVDNGDGTITDLNTGLSWEKKSDDGSIHDKDTTYTWNDAFAVHVATLNTMRFAGHNDWRLPNAKELQSLINYENVNPTVSPQFNTGCAFPGCTVLTCSCTTGADYWSSTSNANFPSNAWEVDFFAGFVRAADKTGGNFVRAVRGGT